ncbi:MAG: hypothetical protein VW475_13885, partial [Curvibacter sp.]
LKKIENPAKIPDAKTSRDKSSSGVWLCSLSTKAMVKEIANQMVKLVLSCRMPFGSSEGSLQFSKI